LNNEGAFMNLPLWLTTFRIISIPIFVFFYYLPFHFAHELSAGIFAAAAITDWIDGYLAREWKQITPLGSFLDPVADKLMVVCALIMLVAHYPSIWFVVVSMIIISREIAVSALREWMAQVGLRNKVAVKNIAKIKTTLQLVAIIGLIASGVKSPILLFISSIILVVSAVLTLWSMMVYLKAAWSDLTLTTKGH
jgi:CDP-diacylglycerol---glycerol-3-phosphate 3-phosphatidyltransferase